MIDFNTIINNIDDDFVESENWKSFDDINVFINYMLYLDEATSYKKRSNRILIETSEVWTRDITIQITSIVEGNFIDCSQFRINKFVVKLNNKNNLIPLVPKPSTNQKRLEWEEYMECCQQLEASIEDIRDEVINYCQKRKDKILRDRIDKYGSIEVYESIMKCKDKIKALDNKIELLQEQEILDDKEINALISERDTLNKLLNIAISEQITIADVTRRTFNISNIKRKVK